ncbi:MAG: 16S rRNA (guanine(527)-N(7))-methyltransferase RsmG [Desulfocapsa sp.]|nr:16S rRNA (guanine(527)-N(7))-methyltransferase RsmG [Desulfocapsa sp.]
MTGLRSGCAQLALPKLDEEAEENLFAYFRELKHWGRRINLIAKGAEDEEILEKHFLDSLTLLPLLGGEKPHLLDIGTGAGFPGLVCKAVRSDLQVTLVEPRLKRVSFLRHVVRTLNLQDTSILECRVEDEVQLPSNGGFTHITSRAVNEIKLFLEMCSRFAGLGVQVICMKGPKWEEELVGWQKSGGNEHFTLVSQRNYVLPDSGGKRHLLVFEKTAKKTTYQR